MNERIRQLALKAYNNSGQTTPEDLSSFMQVFSEKFTELIVKECCDIVNQEALLTAHVPAEVNALIGERLKSVFIKIEEHFGVK